MSVNWLVFLVIAWLATLGLWYAASSSVGELEQTATDVRAQLAAAKAEKDAAVAAHVALSKEIGFRDEAVANGMTDAAALRTAIDGAKTSLGTALGGEESKPSLQEALAAAVTAYQGSQQALAAAKTDLDKEIAARQASESKTDDIEKTFTDQLATVNQQLKDEQQRAENQASTDSKRFDELTASQQTADAAARAAQQALAEFQVQSGREVATKDAQIQALAVRREPAEPAAPDGAILSVGKEGGTAFIDIGGRDGLKRGTRFDVLRPGKAGELIERGSIEVREVHSDMALVGVVGEIDMFDPILPGDVVRNPHFEKGKTTHFFLLGDFPLTLSKDFATARLVELGAVVDGKLTPTTDVLVLGDKELALGDFAPELTETDEYKLADKLGMRIIRLDELTGFLRY